MKMNLKHLFNRIFFNASAVVFFLILTSCGTKVYTSGSYGSLKPYVVKPVYRGENKIGTYISGDVSVGSHQQNIDEEDTNLAMSLRVNRSHTKKNFNYYYGGGFTYGNYKFGSPTNPDVSIGDTESFYAFNAIVGANFNVPTDKMDWRIVGVDFAYHNEFGPYQDRIAKIKEAGNEYVFNQKNLISTTLGSEAVFKWKKGRALAIGVYFGDILNKEGNLKGKNSSFGGFTASYSFKKFTLSYVRESGGDQISSSKFGLHYKLF